MEMENRKQKREIGNRKKEIKLTNHTEKVSTLIGSK